MQQRKKAVLEALEKSLGIVTTACRSVEIDRSTFYRWLKEDKEFAKAVIDIEDVALDFAESQLHKQIKDGIPASTIFYLKTKGKRRGYIEKQEFDHSLSGNINIIEGMAEQIKYGENSSSTDIPDEETEDSTEDTQG